MSGDDRTDGERTADRERISDGDDPFERLDDVGERDGDPFERLDDVDLEGGGKDERFSDDDPWRPPDADQEPPTPDDGALDESATSPSAADPTATEAPSNDPPSTDSDAFTMEPDRAASTDPFEGLETPAESPFDGAGSVFERVESGTIDPDRVWESIAGEGDDDAQAEPSVPEGRYTDVSKHAYCEGCEHFSSPPEVSCGHHTAEIIEFLDMETVRLLDCPVVAERRELEGSE